MSEKEMPKIEEVLAKASVAEAMSSLDLRWKFWQDESAILKEKGFQCDLIWEPYHLLRYGCKCAKKDVLVEVPKDIDKTCKMVVLNSTRPIRDRIWDEGRLYDVAEYDRKRLPTEQPYDIELCIPCHPNSVQEELDILSKAELLPSP